MSSSASNRESRWLRAGIAVFMLATCIRVWVGPTGLVDRAEAQIPDAGAQRMAVLAEARRTNQLLVEIKQLLAKEVLNVRVVSADKKSATPLRRGGAGK